MFVSASIPTRHISIGQRGACSTCLGKLFRVCRRNMVQPSTWVLSDRLIAQHGPTSNHSRASAPPAANPLKNKAFTNCTHRYFAGSNIITDPSHNIRLRWQQDDVNLFFANNKNLNSYSKCQKRSEKMRVIVHSPQKPRVQYTPHKFIADRINSEGPTPIEMS